MNRISIIAAIGARTNVLGKDNGLLWHLPDDLKRFKELTLGHPVIMGRRTWESLPEKVRPLPGRTNIVVTRDASYDAAGAQIATSFPEALSQAKASEGAEEIFVIGGGEIYRLALSFAERLYLTLVEDDTQGTVHFPEYVEFTRELERVEHADGDIGYVWLTLER